MSWLTVLKCQIIRVQSGHRNNTTVSSTRHQGNWWISVVLSTKWLLSCSVPCSKGHSVNVLKCTSQWSTGHNNNWCNVMITYRAVIKYCAFSLNFCEFSWLNQFCRWSTCQYRHWWTQSLENLLKSFKRYNI